MKAKSLILALCGAFVSLTASAQFANTGSSAPAATTNSNEDGWGKFSINYNPVTFDFDGEDRDLSTGFNVSYTKATSIATSAPLFLEWGLGVHYATGTEEDGDFEDKISTLAAYVPVNFIYKFDATDKMAIAPYVGLSARVNILGSEEMSYDGDSEEYDFFDDDDMEETANRFQLGYQFGANIMFNKKFSIGIEYQGFFTEYMEEVDASGWSIGIGFLF